MEKQECPFCNGKKQVNEITEAELYILDDANNYALCGKHINEVLDRIARGEL